MTHSELLKWAVDRCGWEFSNGYGYQDEGHTVRLFLDHVSGGALDALALAVFRKVVFSRHELWSSHGEVFSPELLVSSVELIRELHKVENSPPDSPEKAN